MSLYRVNTGRLNIGGTEFICPGIWTSDVDKLRLLSGMDVLQKFNFMFNFDDKSELAPYGKFSYWFRQSQRVMFDSMEKEFAYSLQLSELTESELIALNYIRYNAPVKYFEERSAWFSRDKISNEAMESLVKKGIVRVDDGWYMLS